MLQFTRSPQPEQVKDAEADELFTFIGHKKQDLPPHACRSADALLSGWKVVWVRTQQAIQDVVDEAPKRNAIIAMLLRLMIVSGITMEGMKYRREKPTPIR